MRVTIFFARKLCECQTLWERNQHKSVNKQFNLHAEVLVATDTDDERIVLYVSDGNRFSAMIFREI